jgi:tetratricopeptide (TPR) repeat protein
VHFQHAALVHPARPHAGFNLGLTYAAERDWEAARESFLEVIEVAPDFFGAHFQLGNVLLAMGDVEGARRAWQKTLEINPGYEPARERLESLPR